MPRASTTMCRFDSSLPRSVGLGPVSWPPGLEALAPSMLTRSQSIWSCSRSRRSIAKCSRCHTPAACQSRRRRQYVMPLPKPSSCGRSSHGIPVCSTYRMPLSAARSSTVRRRPPLRRGSELGDQRFQRHPQLIADFASCHAADDTTFAASPLGCVSDSNTRLGEATTSFAAGREPASSPSSPRPDQGRRGERHCWYLRCWYVLIPTDSPAVTEQSLVTLGARCPSGGAERGILGETWGCLRAGLVPPTGIEPVSSA